MNNLTKPLELYNTELIGAALKLAASGLPVFPCKADKHPLDGSHGFKDATTDALAIVTMFDDPAAALIGVPTGPASGFDVLDFDYRHGAKVWEDANAHRIPETRVHETGSGGRHLLFRCDPRVRNSAGKEGSHRPGIDVRGTGGYVVMPPSPGYRIISDADLAPWPEWLLVPGLALPKRTEEAPRPLTAQLPATPLSVARLEAFRDKLLEAVADAPEGGKHETLRNCARSLGGIAAEAGFTDAAAVEWLLAALPNTVSDWRTARSTASWGLAEGRKQPLQLTGREPPPHETAAESFAGVIEHPTGIGLVRFEDLSNEPDRPYVVKGLLAERDFACIIAQPGYGKSVLAPYLGYKVAQGEDAFGRKTRRGKVFYIAAEDAHGMRNRWRALHSVNGAADGFTLVKGVSNLRDATQVAEVRRLIESELPSLIIVDTLAMAFPGINENDSADMGAVVATTREFTDLGPAVVLIHHTTKADDATPRGHSILNGALDVSLHLGTKDNNGVIRGRLLKNRNGACEAEVAFRIDGLAIGEDEDGDSITAPTLREVAGCPKPAAVKLSAAQNAGLEILRELVAAKGGKPVGKIEWDDTCFSSLRVSSNPIEDNRKKAIRGVWDTLIRKKVISYDPGTDGTTLLPVHSGRAASENGVFPPIIDDIPR